MKPHEYETALFEYDENWHLTWEQIAERARELEEIFEHLPMELEDDWEALWQN